MNPICIDPNLPIAAHQEEIIDALLQHQIIIIAGETGSGKTTQIPKLCLLAGCGREKLIGHTQPRRIAARNIAYRIAQELDVELGSIVGYQTRFNQSVSAETKIKLMTDGILLAEMRHDPLLLRYDTIIIDEAHERSLNIDFLLGYLKKILSRRPDLKLIITSATIDPESFSNYYFKAPVITIPGRTYPVTVFYRPEDDLNQAIIDAVNTIYSTGPGDILLFLPGEQYIRETTKILRELHLPNTEILPLYARLSVKEQQRVFQPHGGSRRIVLATNVAETSITVPGIIYVIDSGLARISEYNYRRKIQCLPISAISQASAEQRKGRCGRIAPGICFRLYAEDDFLRRDKFTKAEILRSNLAGVILTMFDLKLGDIADFDFLQAPDPRHIKAGYNLLEQLGAITADKRLTHIGKQLARLPIDPRLGRMLLAAHKERSLTEVLVIASALTTNDPREQGTQTKAEVITAYQQYNDEKSEFLSFVKLWQTIEKERQQLSNTQFRKWCQKNYLSFLKIQEWRDIHRQLVLVTQMLNFKLNTNPADYAQIHRAVLTGLLNQVGVKDEKGDYLGARGLRFTVFPGSTLYKKPPLWLMAGELMETKKLYARIIAAIEPQWIESIASHLVKKEYIEPHWSEKRGQVVAFERVSFYGLIINPRRTVHYGPIDPKVSQQIFIRDGLVAQAVNLKAKFYQHNLHLIQQIRKREAKLRRQSLLVDDDVLVNFYKQHIPENIYNVPLLEQWLKSTSEEQQKTLFMQESDIIKPGESIAYHDLYPDFLLLAGQRLKLNYHFEPGNIWDGVTVTIPLAVLAQMNNEIFTWLVPGMLLEKIIFLLRGLPKDIRKQLMPINDYAQDCVAAITAKNGDLLDFLTAQIRQQRRLMVKRNDWQFTNMPAHCFMNFRIIDEQSITLAVGRDLEQLKQELQIQVVSQLTTESSHSLQREDITVWDFAEIPKQTLINGCQFYVALHDEQESVAIKFYPTEFEALRSHKQGTRRLYYFALQQSVKYCKKNIANAAQLKLLTATFQPFDQLIDECILTAIGQTFPDLCYQHTEFETNLEKNKQYLITNFNTIIAIVFKIFQYYHELKLALERSKKAEFVSLNQEIEQQLKHLIYPGFINQIDFQWLQRISLYLQAIIQRLEKYPRAKQRDQECSASIQKIEQAYKKFQQTSNNQDVIANFIWLLEEYRISLFAQGLKTLQPVSEKRLLQIIST